MLRARVRGPQGGLCGLQGYILWTLSRRGWEGCGSMLVTLNFEVEALSCLPLLPSQSLCSFQGYFLGASGSFSDQWKPEQGINGLTGNKSLPLISFSSTHLGFHSCQNLDLQKEGIGGHWWFQAAATLISVSHASSSPSSLQPPCSKRPSVSPFCQGQFP